MQGVNKILPKANNQLCTKKEQIMMQMIEKSHIMNSPASIASFI